MQSLIARTKTFLTPSGSSSSLQDASKFRTEKRAELLFQQTDPKVDGDDCLHDCVSCTEHLPKKWSIDEDDKLYGEVNGWETHLIVGTGKSDWVRDVTDEKGSLMHAVGKYSFELSNGKLMLSASNMPPPSYDNDNAHQSSDGGKWSEYGNEGRTRCIIMPRWETIDNVGIHDAKWLLEDVMSQSITNSTPLPKEAPRSAPLPPKPIDGELVVQKEPELGDPEDTTNFSGLSLTPSNSQKLPVPQIQKPNQIDPSTIPPGITIKPLPHRAVILMCSHGTRDWRCGKSAPILKREFERHLRPLGLYRDYDDERPGGVGVYYINHVGGHKYSANVMVYRRQGGFGDGRTEKEMKNEAVQGIWLARVRPEDCENIVKFTVLQGKLVKPQRQLRGGFDRERGVLSW